MLSAVVGFLLQLLLAVLLASLDVLLVSLAATMRLVPALTRLLLRLLRRLIIVSTRVYATILSAIEPEIQRRFGVRILTGPWRVLASIVLSLLLGILLLLGTGLPANKWTVGLPVLHGLVVGLLWDEDEAEEPSGLHLGTKQP